MPSFSEVWLEWLDPDRVKDRIVEIFPHFATLNPQLIVAALAHSDIPPTSINLPPPARQEAFAQLPDLLFNELLRPADKPPSPDEPPAPAVPDEPVLSKSQKKKRRKAAIKEAERLALPSVPIDDPSTTSNDLQLKLKDIESFLFNLSTHLSNLSITLPPTLQSQFVKLLPISNTSVPVPPISEPTISVTPSTSPTHHEQSESLPIQKPPLSMKLPESASNPSFKTSKNNPLRKFTKPRVPASHPRPASSFKSESTSLPTFYAAFNLNPTMSVRPRSNSPLLPLPKKFEVPEWQKPIILFARLQNALSSPFFCSLLF